VSRSTPRARRAARLDPPVRSAWSITARSIGTPFQWVTRTGRAGSAGELGVGERAVDLRHREDRAVPVVALLEQEGQEGDPAAVGLGQRVRRVQVAQGREDGAELVVELLLREGRRRPAFHGGDAGGQGVEAAERVHGVERPLERQVDVVAGQQLPGLGDEQRHLPGSSPGPSGRRSASAATPARGAKRSARSTSPSASATRSIGASVPPGPGTVKALG
jgi:hypothetical protein